MNALSIQVDYKEKRKNLVIRVIHSYKVTDKKKQESKFCDVITILKIQKPTQKELKNLEPICNIPKNILSNFNL